MKKLQLAVLSDALVMMAACGGSNHSPAASPSPMPSPTPTANNVSIPVGARTLGSAAYVPNPVMITVGSTVTWTNNDTIPHTSTSDNGVFDSGNMAAGAKFSFTFNTRGTFPYHCTFHPGMVASVVVQ
jgi:plastocyanin